MKVIYISRCMKKEEKLTVKVQTFNDRYLFPCTIITVNLN